MQCALRKTQTSATRVAAKQRQQTVVHATRRQLGVQLLTIGVGLLGAAGRSHAEDTGASSLSSPSSTPSTDSGFIAIAPVNKDAKAYMDMRDEAMDYKCKGGMFDCDGDRREFAHKQYTDWLESGGVPKRIREGKPGGPRSY